MLTDGCPIITQTSARTVVEQEWFIRQNADALARFGYARYREGGRGLIALFPEDVLRESGRVERGQLYYLQAEDLLSLFERRAGESGAQIAYLHELWGSVEMYDPDRSIIVCFLSLTRIDGENRVNTYLVNCATPPALAYAAYTN